MYVQIDLLVRLLIASYHNNIISHILCQWACVRATFTAEPSKLLISARPGFSRVLPLSSNFEATHSTTGCGLQSFSDA